MAESSVRALERQLEALQKVFAAQMAGGFPRLVLSYGDETFEEAMTARGLDYVALEEIGISIKHISLPWLTGRRLLATDDESDASAGAYA